MKYCHPNQIQFKKETADAPKEETSGIEERIKKLKKNDDNFGGTK
jgi:hypothetical protein